MKLIFWTVGGKNEPFVKEGIDMFTKRIEMRTRAFTTIG
jgi:hypothetical protein